MTRHPNQPRHPLLRIGLSALFMLILIPGPLWAACEHSSFRKLLLKEYSGVEAVVIARVGLVLESRSTFLIADGPTGGLHSNGEIKTYEFQVQKSLMGEVPGKIKGDLTVWEGEESRGFDISPGGNYFLLLRPIGQYFEIIGCHLPEHSEEARLKKLFLDIYLKKVGAEEAIRNLWMAMTSLLPDLKIAGIKKDSARHQVLEELLHTMARELKRLPEAQLKIVTEICGLLAEKDEKSEQVFFEFFKQKVEG